jgi:hypothetical protein
MTRLRALLVLSLALTGCASTSGHEWLNSPVDQQTRQAPTSAPPAETAAEYRPRLSHTVTLGESYEVATEPGLASDRGAPTVQVNVSTPVIVNNLGGYGYGSAYGYGRSSSYNYGAVGAARGARSAPAPKVGADFPAPPDYGPRALR